MQTDTEFRISDELSVEAFMPTHVDPYQKRGRRMQPEGPIMLDDVPF